MKRILLSAMQYQNDLYHYENRPFTGIGFEISQNEVVRGYEMEAGKICRRYIPVSLHERNNNALMEVNISGDVAVYEAQEYQDKPYTGIAYIFRKDHCSREIFFREGFQEAGADWNQNGVMNGFGISTGSFGEGAEWFDNGQLKSAEISTSRYYSTILAFTEDGKLRLFIAKNNFVDALPKIAAETTYFPIKSISEIKQYQCAEEICIWGNDIDDELIRSMVTSNMLNGTRILEFKNTAIQQWPLLFVELTPMLQEVLIEHKDETQIALAKDIKKHRPELQVTFNKEVMATINPDPPIRRFR